MSRRVPVALLALSIVVACSDGPDGRDAETRPPSDAAPSTDAAATSDAGVTDTSAPLDSSLPPADASSRDASVAFDATPGQADGSSADAAIGDGSALDAGTSTALQAPAGVWTWFDFPESTCDDGTPTGIGVNLAPGNRNLLIYLNGGGACWDYQTCFVLNTSAHGPFGRTQFDFIAGLFGSTVGSRTEAQSPFREWNMVFVPYCTGDVHAGDNVASYVDPNGGAHPFHHRGRANLVAFLRRISATFPSIEKLALSGSSAGGFGALFNYEMVKTALTPGKMYLIDDSGPPFVGDDVKPALRDAWFTNWNLAPALLAFGCTACRGDLSAGITTLVARHPNDRFALLSSLEDQVIRGYYEQSPAEFEAGLNRLAAQVLDPAPTFRYFFIGGSSHTMLGSPGFFSSQGTGLWTWLGDQVNDSPNWSSLRPP